LYELTWVLDTTVKLAKAFSKKFFWTVWKTLLSDKIEVTKLKVMQLTYDFRSVSLHTKKSVNFLINFRF
jgi:hypothetical protein